MVIDTVHMLKDTALCKSSLTQMEKMRGEVVLACCLAADDKVRIEAGAEARSSDLYLNGYQLDNSACEEYSLQSHGLIWGFGMVLK